MARILILDNDPRRHHVWASRLACNQLVHVFNYEQAAAALVNGPYDLALLDHDLGTPKNGTDVARFIIALPPERRPRSIVVHSQNPVGGRWMTYLISQAGIPVTRQPFTVSR